MRFADGPDFGRGLNPAPGTRSRVPGRFRLAVLESKMAVWTALDGKGRGNANGLFPAAPVKGFSFPNCFQVQLTALRASGLAGGVFVVAARIVRCHTVSLGSGRGPVLSCQSKQEELR